MIRPALQAAAIFAVLFFADRIVSGLVQCQALGCLPW